MARARASRGFTLIELLVALAVLAMMAAMSWSGIDSMLRTHSQTQQRSEELMALEAGLGQWAADLDGMVQLAQLPALDWDGRVLRLIRRSSAWAGDGLLVAAWSRRATGGAEGRWLRWQSPPLRTRGELDLAWQKAAQWAQNPGDEERKREVSIVALTGWQIFYFRSDAWTNPLSSGDSNTDPAPASSVSASTTATGTLTVALAPGAGNVAAVPDGVRLVLTLPGEHPLGGVLTRDWVRPNLGGGK